MNRLIDVAALLANYIKARPIARFRTRAALEAHQVRALERFKHSVLQRSPFYRHYAASDLADYPMMNKTQMMRGFNEINTRGVDRATAFALAEQAEETRDFSPMIGDVSVGLSTGTSGQRGLFLASRRERMRWAGVMLGRMLPGGLLAPHRIAFLLRANNHLYESVAGKGRIAFRFYDLKQSLSHLRPQLAAFDPSILIAPAQVLRALAMQGTGRHALRPRTIISVAETLFDDDRTLIEATFGQPVAQIYQCTEGFLAYTCSAGRLHLNETFLHIEREWLDREQRHYHPIITDFSRETQPIVRYRLDDVLVDDPRPCPCGSVERTIARIEGRADDVLTFRARAGGGKVQVMPDFIARAIAGAGGGSSEQPLIEDFRVQQECVEGLIVRLQTSDMPHARVLTERALMALFDSQAVQAPHLVFEAMTPQDFTSKRRRVMRSKAIAA